MAKIRILVVDDSVVVRRLLAKVLASDPALEVSATAANGRIALAMLPQVHPDLVLLDVVMDQMDGLETLTELRKTYPRLPVLMFSTYTERGAAQTLEAIARGATDYVTKPTTLSGQDGGLNALKDQLIPKIKELCRVREGMGAEALPRPRLDKGGALPRPVEILVIGTSTGGPNALTELLTPLPGDFPVPIAIVQHMPPLFTRSLADRLASRCQIAVEEGVAGGAVRPGHAWVAPGNYHMTLVPDGETVRLGLNQDPPENSCRPAVDVLFRSAAAVFGAGTLGVVLTGMGYDGLRGSEHIRAAGGQVLVQDPATAVVGTMPESVARAGLADGVFALPELGRDILRRVRRGRAALPGPKAAEGRP